MKAIDKILAVLETADHPLQLHELKPSGLVGVNEPAASARLREEARLPNSRVLSVPVKNSKCTAWILTSRKDEFIQTGLPDHDPRFNERYSMDEVVG